MSNLERKDLGVYIADQAAEGAVDANPVFTKIRDAKTIVKSSPTYTTSDRRTTSATNQTKKRTVFFTRNSSDRANRNTIKRNASWC